MRTTATVFAAMLLASTGCSDDAGLGRVVPTISVSGEPIDFDVVPVGATRRRSLTIRNQGTADLQIASVRPLFTGSSSQLNPFSVSEGGPIGVAPGGQLAIDIAFFPAVNEGVSGTLVITSDDPENPEITINLQGQGGVGQLVVQPDALDLEDTTVGRSRAVEVVVQNLGTVPVEGARLATEGFERPQNFRLTGLPDFAVPAPFALDARVRQVLLLTYEPQEIGSDEGIIRIETCGTRCGPEVRVTASASDALVRLVPPSLDFGGVGIGQPRSESLEVENVGTVPAEIRTASVAGSAAFSVDVPSGDLPITLQPQERLGLTVTFAPTDAGQARGSVVVTTSLGSVPELQASLTGQGEGPLFVVTPATIDFGTERGPGLYQRTLVLNNAGSSEVLVTSIGLSGTDTLRLGDFPGLPFRLGPGASVFVPVVFEPTAIGLANGMLSVTSNYEVQPTTTVPVSAAMADAVCQLSFSPGQLRFGVMPVGHRRARRVQVTNTGPDVCRIESGAFRSPPDSDISLVTGSSLPVDLYPSTSSVGTTSLAFDFTYAPEMPRDAKATFVLRTQDPFFPDRTVSLLGRSQAFQAILFRPERIDFGAMIPQDCPEFTDTVRMFNVGNTSVRHISAQLTSPTLAPLSPEFRLAPDSVPDAFSGIPPGEVVSYELGYLAANLGVDSAELEVVLEGYPLPFVVPLQGEGDPEATRTEVFEQVDNKEVDVLFVIDDSCSMEENQRQVAANFGSFIQEADNRQVDFRLGITTTDTTQNPGALVGPVITRATPGFAAEFQQQAAVGILGSGIETGLEAMKAALDEADRGTRFNVDLLRETAALVVIIVSDEDDQSALTPAQYANDLQLRTPNGVLTAVVSGQQTGCSSPAGNAASAPDYEDFLSFFGNSVSASICADWGTTLADLGGEAFGLKRSFRLSIDPDLMQPVVVTVNGVLQIEGTDYTLTGREVVFSTDSVPQEGAMITIEYNPDCTP